MAETSKKRLVLLDAHAILHRAYHALPDFTSQSGEPTGALYGLVSMLLKTIGELKPDYVVACYDMPKPTFRKIAYADYKGTRAKTDDTLIDQIKRSQDVFRAFSIPIYEKEGFEADDILGSIIEEIKKETDLDIIIASGDMDTLQLVDDERVRIYTLKKGIKDTILYDEAAVKERFGFGPELLPDFKGLRGDPSDNIPGVKGIGEKTATGLITTFGSIENIYTELKEDKGSFKKKADVTERIANLLLENKEEAEFSKMLAQIRRDADIDFELPENTWRETIDAQQAEELFRSLDFRTLASRLSSLLESPKEKDSAKEETEEEEHIDERELKETAIALWLINSETTSPTKEDVLRFARTDDFAKARRIVFEKLKEEGLEGVFETIEKPLIPVIEKMEDRGVKIDIEVFAALSREYRETREKVKREIFDLAGVEFNINSPKQLGEILFDTLEIPTTGISKTSTGARSTRESELEKLHDKHPIIEKIFEYREVQKLLSTYIDVIPKLVDDKNRLHTTFLQAGTTTGRLASQNPNLQNIPIRSKQGRAIRRGFVASEGYTLVSADYSQIELRIASILSHDEKLMNVFKNGGDAHAAVAAEVFEVPEERVDKEMRRRAKVINFGILYGMGVNALSKSLGTDRKEAQEFLNDYFSKFSGLRDYLELTKTSARQKGYTETLFGRKRWFSGIRSNAPYIRASAERMAINAPIQGTQADLTKRAMVQVDEYIAKQGLQDRAFLLLQIHDELIAEVETSLVDEVAEDIQRIMRDAFPGDKTEGVPIKVDVSVGPNWGEMKEKD